MEVISTSRASFVEDVIKCSKRKQRGFLEMVKRKTRKVVVDMAVNYTLGQAFKKIADGTDTEAIADIARRFPMVAVNCAKLVDKADVVGPLFDSLPDYLTARKVEKGLRGPVSDDEPVEEEAEEEKPAPKKRGRKAAPKKEAEPDTKEEADEADSKYAGKAAPELFKECKKRGIKAAPKKPAKYYIDLLEKDDVKGGESEDEDDDWDI